MICLRLDWFAISTATSTSYEQSAKRQESVCFIFITSWLNAYCLMMYCCLSFLIASWLKQFSKFPFKPFASEQINLELLGIVERSFRWLVWASWNYCLRKFSVYSPSVWRISFHPFNDFNRPNLGPNNCDDLNSPLKV